MQVMMGIYGYNRGHKVYCQQDKSGVYSIWRYSDDHSSLKDSPTRKCPRCEKLDTKEGHDHCIANLPNVDYACCGHGVDDGYVKMSNGKTIRFNTDYDREKIIKIVTQNL